MINDDPPSGPRRELSAPLFAMVCACALAVAFAVAIAVLHAFRDVFDFAIDNGS